MLHITQANVWPSREAYAQPYHPGPRAGIGQIMDR